MNDPESDVHSDIKPYLEESRASWSRVLRWRTTTSVRTHAHSNSLLSMWTYNASFKLYPVGVHIQVRSGAKELLARAVASLLAIRPTNPVVFLAHHFDTSASSVQRSVRLLRACPPHGAAFQDALFQVFRWLSVDESSATEPSLLEKLRIPVRSTLPRSSYELLVGHLSAEFPELIRDRMLDAVRTIHSRGAEVSMNEFQRGVRICVLLEELLDMVDELFFSIDKGRMGDVNPAVLMSALENAASQRGHPLDATVLDIFKSHLRRHHAIPSLLTGSTSTLATMPDDDDATHPSLSLVDLHEIIFRAVFTP